jgi:hypothetical protein
LLFNVSKYFLSEDNAIVLPVSLPSAFPEISNLLAEVSSFTVFKNLTVCIVPNAVPASSL